MPERPPRWPRLLSEEEAAEYVGVSLTRFRIERDKGMWPAPVDRGCRLNTYDRLALDRAVDRLSGWQEPREVEGELLRRAGWGRSG